MQSSEKTQEADAIRVWFRLLRLETRIRLAVSARLKAIGLSVPQCDVLTTLTEREGLSQQELAARLYVTKGNISGLIDRLVSAGLVERREIEGDRRSRSIFLTEEGRQMALSGIKAQQSFAIATFGQLESKDLATLETLLIAARDLVRAKTAGDSITP
ncbi:MAG TPA: MarR family transcriptional regulator [Beijerinckia sp.]|jgi:DNA-binding MarR family transcriptional regulator|nr:MarR family transcriptional regulator [Beijerinckia sp.]